MAALLSIATAVPAHELRQRDVIAAARDVFSKRYPSYHLIEPVFANAGIDTRYGVRPMTWYTQPRGWPERTQVYLESATELFVEAAAKALAVAQLDAADVDAVVTISSTGIATPSLEARACAASAFEPMCDARPSSASVAPAA